MNDAEHTPDAGKHQPGTHYLGPILGPHKGDHLSREQQLDEDVRKIIEIAKNDPTLFDDADQSARIAELERELSRYRGPAINPPCPVCPSSTPDQVIFSPVYGGNRHFYCKSCEQSFAGSFTYGPSELERRVEELTKENEDLQQFKAEVDAEGVVPASRVQLLSNYEHAFRDIGLLLGFDAADTEGASPEEIVEKVNAELSQLRAQVETLTKERDEARAERDTAVECFEAVKKLHGHACNQWAESIAQRQDLRAQLAASEADRWQSIETAPKDGTEVLLLEHGVVLHCQWGGDFHNAWVYCGRCGFADHATHWQPLPQPPARKEEAK